MKKFLIFCFLSIAAMSTYGQADNNKKGYDTKKEKKATKEIKKEETPNTDAKVAGKVYVFGCSFQFGDSIVYFTPVEEVDSIALTKKTKFLPYCTDFSQQLKDKLESPAFGLKDQTSSVFYSNKKLPLQMKLDKMKKRYLKKGEVRIVQLSQEQFKFVHPLDYYTE